MTHNHPPDEPCRADECQGWTLAGAAAAAQSQRFTETLGTRAFPKGIHKGPVSGRVKIDHPFVTERSTKAEILKALQEHIERTDRAIELLGEQITKERQDNASRAAANEERHASLLNDHRTQASRERQRLQTAIGEGAVEIQQLRSSLEKAVVTIDALAAAIVAGQGEQGDDA